MMASRRPGPHWPKAEPVSAARGHLFVVAALCALVTLAALVAPGGDVEATRGDPTADELAAPIEESGPTIAADDTTAAAQLADADADAEDAAGAEAALTQAAQEMAPAAAAGKPATQAVARNEWRELMVQSGDNLSLLFKRAGFSDRDVYEIVHTAPQGKALERIYPGQTIAFLTDSEGRLSAVRHVLDPLQTVVYRRMDGGYSHQLETRTPQVREATASLTIESSLFVAGRSAGLSSNQVLEVANIFSGVVDFALDPRKGDTMHVIFEEQYLDGQKFANGRILAASFSNKGETFNAYLYRDSDGGESYYNEQGVSMRKAFLMAPLDFTRISSNFNLRRLHPIYKTTRPHRGTDYAAPTGTPVFASGDGRVVESGYTRANGNYVVIRHSDKYTTKYLHLHKRKVREGQRVVQSQLIGTVGATGAATGPHLHYEFLVDGVHRNPRTIHRELPKAKSLAAVEMPRFREQITPVMTQLAQLQQGGATQLALADTGGSGGSDSSARTSADDADGSGEQR